MKKRKLAQFVRPLFACTRILDIFSFSSRMGSHIDYSRYQNTGDWNIRRMIADIRNTGLRVFLYCMRQSYTFDRGEKLDQIEIPVLIMHGKNDTIFPVENSKVMAQKIKNSTLILLNDADHILVLNHLTEVCNAIENFVEETKSLALSVSDDP